MTYKLRDKVTVVDQYGNKVCNGSIIGRCVSVESYDVMPVGKRSLEDAIFNLTPDLIKRISR